MILNRNILEKIEKNEGESFYIADLKQFEKNYNSLLDSYRNYYPKTSIAYSYKTNYLPDFCKIVEKNGGYAEVVSGMEMQLALKIGVEHKNIFFNGPVKEFVYVEELLLNGGIVNVDSLDELNKIIHIANSTDKIVNIGMRLNFDVEDGVVSRFGFDPNEDNFHKALPSIDAISNLQLVSLHCHFATRYLETWENRTKGILHIIDKYFKDRLEKIKFISLGGGLYGDMTEDMKNQFEKFIPSFDDYAKVASKVFNEYFEKIDFNPTLIIEPGTALAANAMKYVTKVESIKRAQGKDIATLFGSTYNVNPKANRKKVPIEIYTQNKEQQKYFDTMDFAGYTCIESDYLYKGYQGNLAVDDFIVFDEVGTYSIVMKAPFIMPQVSIVKINENTYEVLKEKETFEDVFKTYKI